MSADERETVYKCTIIDFSLAHKFSPDAVPTQAFKLQEMGVDGTGSLEKSDLESTKFWRTFRSRVTRRRSHLGTGITPQMPGVQSGDPDLT